jgi:hypothetical protein
MGVESKLYGLTDETIVCCETETQGFDHAGRFTMRSCSVSAVLWIGCA